MYYNGEKVSLWGEGRGWVVELTGILTGNMKNDNGNDSAASVMRSTSRLNVQPFHNNQVVEFKDYNPLVGLPVKAKPRDRNDENYFFSKPVYNHLTKRFMYN